ncbi:MAG: hypothetical protein QOK10_657, partial [Pseudonocardiales bacterium]|nr:hypothetical protein [Pseudonocardiales bacterium]
FYRGEPITGLTALILRERVVPRRNWNGTPPPSGYFQDEVALARKLTSDWATTLFDGLTPELIIEWMGGEDGGITPEQAVTFHQAGVTPRDLNRRGDPGHPSLRLGLEVGNITVEQAIEETKRRQA